MKNLWLDCDHCHMRSTPADREMLAEIRPFSFQIALAIQKIMRYTILWACRMVCLRAGGTSSPWLNAQGYPCHTF